MRSHPPPLLQWQTGSCGLCCWGGWCILQMIRCCPLKQTHNAELLVMSYFPLNNGLLLLRVSNRAELGSFFHLWLIMTLSDRAAGDGDGRKGEEMQLILAEGEITTLHCCQRLNNSMHKACVVPSELQGTQLFSGFKTYLSFLEVMLLWADRLTNMLIRSLGVKQNIQCHRTK